MTDGLWRVVQVTEVSRMTPRFEPGKVVSCGEIKQWFSFYLFIYLFILLFYL